MSGQPTEMVINKIIYMADMGYVITFKRFAGRYELRLTKERTGVSKCQVVNEDHITDKYICDVIDFIHDKFLQNG